MSTAVHASRGEVFHVCVCVCVCLQTVNGGREGAPAEGGEAEQSR